MAGISEGQTKVVRARSDYHSTDFQTHLERRFTPGRIRGSAKRQVWKSTLLAPTMLCIATRLFRTRTVERVRLDHLGRGAFPGAPAAVSLSAFIVLRLAVFQSLTFKA